jgi:hypothetical protein
MGKFQMFPVGLLFIKIHLFMNIGSIPVPHKKRFDFLNRLLTVTILHNSLTTRIEVDLIGFIQQFDPAICSDPDLLVGMYKILLPIDSSTQRNK